MNKKLSTRQQLNEVHEALLSLNELHLRTRLNRALGLLCLFASEHHVDMSARGEVSIDLAIDTLAVYIAEPLSDRDEAIVRALEGVEVAMGELKS